MPNEQKTILIAEDEKPMAHALELKLSKAGFTVVSINDGEAALQALKDSKFDIVLLDLMMPKLDGFEVMEQMKLLNNKTPVIIISNLGQAEDEKRAKALGAVDYIIKSDTPIGEIVERVKKFVTA